MDWYIITGIISTILTLCGIRIIGTKIYSKVLFIILYLGGMVGILISFVGLMINEIPKNKPKYNFLYKVDPKQNGFIIYNINEDRYDTISKGQLETYIMNDNL